MRSFECSGDSALMLDDSPGHMPERAKARPGAADDFRDALRSVALARGSGEPQDQRQAAARSAGPQRLTRGKCQELVVESQRGITQLLCPVQAREKGHAPLLAWRTS